MNRRVLEGAGFRCGFTLLETLISLGIVAILIAMLVPNLERIQEASWNARCLGNLRQIGVAALLCAQDNQNTIPRVEKNPAAPVYPESVGAKNLLDTLSPYGITLDVLKCPADVRSSWNQFSKLGSSYEWLNYFDGDKLGSLRLLTPGGTFDTPPSQARLVIDWQNVHYTTGTSDDPSQSPGRRNAIYADGHVAVSGG